MHVGVKWLVYPMNYNIFKMSILILNKIKNQIEKDILRFQNCYWNLNFNLTEGYLQIMPVKYYTYDKVIFMGEVLMIDCSIGDYLFELCKKYPLIINFTSSDGCKITIDEAKLRKNKIKKLLNG